MKLAVIDFSGNVGKTPIARHLLAPRIEGAALIAVESIDADDGQITAIRSSQFCELQEICRRSRTPSSTSARATSRACCP